MVKLLSRMIALALPVLAACGGGSSPAPLPQGATAANTGSAQAESQSDAARQPLSTTIATSDDLLYVGNTGNNSITVYHHDASGDTAPLYVIAGSKTGLSSPGQLSEDSQGNLYVANSILSNSKTVSPAILVFAHGANGNVAPIREIAGPLTGIHGPQAVTVDRATGKIFVSDLAEENGISSLLRFPPNAAGNVSPFARSANTLSSAVELASDSTGNNVIESEQGVCCSAFAMGVQTFQKQFANGSDLGTLYSVFNFTSNGLADDPTTKTYLVQTSSGMYRFAEDTVGQFAGDGAPNSFKPGIVSILSSATCGSQLAVGYLRNIYATCGNSVIVYAHDSSGEAPPLRVLRGPATQLNGAYGLYEGK